MKKIIVLLLLVFTFSEVAYSFALSVGTNHVKINQSTTITLDVSPGNPGDYTYDWSTDIGSIQGTGNIVTFNAPGGKGIATISVTANSGGSPAYAGSVSVLVFKSIFIMKNDDYTFTDWASGTNYIRPTWVEYLDYMESVQAKTSAGLQTQTLEICNSSWINATKGYYNRGYVNFYCHGYAHEYFTQLTAQQQLDLFTLSESLCQSVLGFPLEGFGSPYNSNNADTDWALSNTPEMKYFFFGPGGFTGYTFLSGSTRLDAEINSGTIDYNMYLNNYASMGSRDVNIIQTHPPWWDNHGNANPPRYDLDEWDKVITHLRSEGVTILSPMDYIQMINDPAFIPDEGPGGGGEDTTPPSNISSVNDGTGADIDSTSSTTQLSANWTPSTDGDSWISGYKYAIGTTAGGTNVVGWTTLGNVTTVTKNGLNLTVGITYYFSVKAVNGYNLESSPTNSDGQLVSSGGGNNGGGIPIVKTYPNPLITSRNSKMTFQVNEPGGEVKIYTLSGKLVRKLVIGAGESEVDWDILNNDGNSITSGLYVYNITDGVGAMETGKIAIVAK
jgi:hypothetical protein